MTKHANRVSGARTRSFVRWLSSLPTVLFDPCHARFIFPTCCRLVLPYRVRVNTPPCVFSKVHYPCFNQEVLVSAGNDQRLIFWDHRPFEHSQRRCARPKNSPAAEGGNARKSEGDHGVVPNHNRKSHSSGKRKARATKGAKGSSAPAVGLQGSRDTSLSRSQGPQEGGADYCGTATGGGGGGDEGGGTGEGRMMCPHTTCSIPLSITSLEEKPNWISSVSVPYDAILVADTSSEAKVLRRRGT